MYRHELDRQTLLTMALTGALIALSGNAPAGAAEPATWKSLATSFQFSNGKVTFKEQGKDLIGTYPGDGRLDCKWTGVRYSEYDCTWSDSTRGSGKAKLWFLGNGELTGVWGRGKSDSNGGSWTFTAGSGPAQRWKAVANTPAAGGGAKACNQNDDCHGQGPGTTTRCLSGKCVSSIGTKCRTNSDCGYEVRGTMCRSGICAAP